MSQTAGRSLADHVIPHVPVRRRWRGPPFVEVNALTDDELHALQQTIITRLMKTLTRRGVLIEEMGQTYLAEPDADGDEWR